MADRVSVVAKTKRFATHSDEQLLQKKAKIIPDTTKKSNSTAARAFREYLGEKGQDVNFEGYDAVSLNETLSHFYIDCRREDGTHYKTNSLESFRYGLNRYLKAPPHCKKFDIIKDPLFTDANETFKTAINELKQLGHGTTTHYPVISRDDRSKLYSSMHLNPNTPYGLLNKVMFDIRLYFCRRGLENMEKMTKATFAVKVDSNTGLKYVYKVVDELSKNHRANDKENVSGFMPEEPNSPMCPVTSFENYISKLHPELERLWQYPRDSFLDDDTCWFTRKPLGKDAMSTFMSKLSKRCKLSQVYTNHSIRATGATILSQFNFSASQIMAVTGHKSVSSLSVYQRVSEDEKLVMGKAMTAGLAPTNYKSALPPPSKLPADVTSGSVSTLALSNPTPATPSDDDDCFGNFDLESFLCDYDELDDTMGLPKKNNQVMNLSQANRRDTGPVFNNCTFSGPINFVINK